MTGLFLKLKLEMSWEIYTCHAATVEKRCWTFFAWNFTFFGRNYLESNWLRHGELLSTMNGTKQRPGFIDGFYLQLGEHECGCLHEQPWSPHTIPIFFPSGQKLVWIGTGLIKLDRAGPDRDQIENERLASTLIHFVDFIYYFLCLIL